MHAVAGRPLGRRTGGPASTPADIRTRSCLNRRTRNVRKCGFRALRGGALRAFLAREERGGTSGSRNADTRSAAAVA